MLQEGGEWEESSGWYQIFGECETLVSLQVKYAKVLHEAIMLVPVLLYRSKTTIWKEKQRPRNRAVQMNNFKGL